MFMEFPRVPIQYHYYFYYLLMLYFHRNSIESQFRITEVKLYRANSMSERMRITLPAWTGPAQVLD